MSRKRRSNSPEFKAMVALGAIKGDMTLSELARRYEINTNLVVKWKKQLLENSAELFASGNGLPPDRQILRRIYKCADNEKMLQKEENTELTKSI